MKHRVYHSAERRRTLKRILTHSVICVE